MNKELILYIPTPESGDEMNVKTLRSSPEKVLLHFGSQKVVVDIEDLKQALNELVLFNRMNAQQTES